MRLDRIPLEGHLQARPGARVLCLRAALQPRLFHGRVLQVPGVVPPAVRWRDSRVVTEKSVALHEVLPALRAGRPGANCYNIDIQ